MTARKCIKCGLPTQGKTRYKRGLCSKCYQRAAHDGTLGQHAIVRPDPRAWLKAFLSDIPPTDDCIEWPFAKVAGYGVISRASPGTKIVTRIVLERVSGAALGRLDACHSCDNPPCINPRHLFPGTRADNHEDAARKLRKGRKLTPQQAREIKGAAAASSRQLAAVYGISHTWIKQIRRGRFWKHA